MKTGPERVADANKLADSLIDAGHTDASDILNLINNINEAWSDVIDFIATRIDVSLVTWLERFVILLRKYYPAASEFVEQKLT